VANTLELAPPPCLDELREALPLDPWRSLRVRFGMLLGEEDFTTIGAYHRGKGWLHNAWLHRQGVVWGFGVELARENREVRVLPGLALDALGRELHLDQTACLDAGAWFDEHADDPGFEIEDVDGGKRFTAHVIARFRPCLDRAVPAMAEPCAGDARSVAHSRVVETVELLLLPGAAPQRTEPPLPYHRLRLLFGLEPAHTDDGGTVLPADQEVLDARDAILGLPAADQPAAHLDAFRRFAALDVVDLRPAPAADGEAMTLVPGAEPGDVVLAEITDLTLLGEPGAWRLDSGNVDVTVRHAHVATATIQELLCGALLAGALAAVAGPDGGVAPLAAAPAPAARRRARKNASPRKTKR
jgi:hypothetical protein